MGDDTQEQCRWAALAGAEAAIAPSELVDLPPKVQVARGRELLSMLGCGKEDASKPPAAQNRSRESDRQPSAVTSEMDSGASITCSLPRHLDSLASQTQASHPKPYTLAWTEQHPQTPNKPPVRVAVARIAYESCPYLELLVPSRTAECISEPPNLKTRNNWPFRS